MPYIGWPCIIDESVWTEFLSFLLFFCLEFKSPSGTTAAGAEPAAVFKKLLPPAQPNSDEPQRHHFIGDATMDFGRTRLARNKPVSFTTGQFSSWGVLAEMPSIKVPVNIFAGSAKSLARNVLSVDQIVLIWRLRCLPLDRIFARRVRAHAPEAFARNVVTRLSRR